MRGGGRGKPLRPLVTDIVGHAVMDHRRRPGVEPAMMVLVVVPGEEPLPERVGVLQGADALGKRGAWGSR